MSPRGRQPGQMPASNLSLRPPFTRSGGNPSIDGYVIAFLTKISEYPPSPLIVFPLLVYISVIRLHHNCLEHTKVKSPTLGMFVFAMCQYGSFCSVYISGVYGE